MEKVFIIGNAKVTLIDKSGHKQRKERLKEAIESFYRGGQNEQKKKAKSV